MILVTSLLEMKKGENVTKRIMRSLPVEVLKRNMSKVYKKYKNLYCKSGVNYVKDSWGHVITKNK